MENKYHFAKNLIYQAGRMIRTSMLEDDLVIETKSSQTDLVTDLDRKVQDMFISEILKHYPNDHILAEENDVRHDIEDGSVWVIDPIDGTINFITQGTEFAVMLAYFEQGQGKFAFIYDVMGDSLYHGGGEFPVLRNNEPLPRFENRPLQTYLIAANSGMFQKNEWGVADLASKSLGIRIYGSAGLSFAKVISGQLLTYASYVWPWDYAAASILGNSLDYDLLTLDGEKPDFQTRQPIILLPKEKREEVSRYLPSLKEG